MSEKIKRYAEEIREVVSSAAQGCGHYSYASSCSFCSICKRLMLISGNLDLESIIIDGDSRDAGRYRALRNETSRAAFYVVNVAASEPINGEPLDKLIDAHMRKPIGEDRLLNTRSWAMARPYMSGSEVIIAAIDELLERRKADAVAAVVKASGTGG